ncbi:MAG: glycosyltransferase [Sulfuricellaceae bacterium]|nr:glycosyltransferase [Sulfuricellaceae bacterium]
MSLSSQPSTNIPILGQDDLISISIVSHGQGILVISLLDDLARLCRSQIEIILTLNTSETISFSLKNYPFPVRVVKNAAIQGFGTNHNSAFQLATGALFCVLNPDVRLGFDPFPALLSCLKQWDAGVVAPMVCNEQGEPEDSARTFPSLGSILWKVMSGKRPRLETRFPDWVAGMMMLFPSNVFDLLGGFDEHYFLYYEDVDICARLHLAHKLVAYCPEAVIQHEARRSSHRHPVYLAHHMASLARFLTSPVRRDALKLRQMLVDS